MTMNPNELIAKIKSADESARAGAWLHAESVGAPAVKPLAGVLADKDIEGSRAAKRALWRIVRHAGRPGADGERNAVVLELVAVLGDHKTDVVQREVIWMLSEIGGDESVAPIARLLVDADLREDARMSLQRIPGDTSIAALRAALAAAPDDFRPNLAQSLRARGVDVLGIPCRKLVPTKRTEVKQVARPG